MSSQLRIGVDLGGTKIEAVALSADGAEAARERVDAPRGDYRDTIDALIGLAARVAAEAGAARGPLGVGIPGSTSPTTGLVRNANSTWLNDRPFEADLASAWGAPVRVANDANCFALSEATDGAAVGAKSAFGVIIGTGVGGGLVADGRLIGGANGIGGEWGHAPLPNPTPEETPGPLCWCGRRGCVETWCSGPALAADYSRATGREATAKEVASLAAAGDRAAESAIERHGERLGRALAMVANIFDPEAIVLGGGLSNLPGIAERARRAMIPHVFSDKVATRIVPNLHGDSSGVRGAARLWPLEGD
ncbi:MAG: ROK family protein [Pseudomonadota bacterium]